jgi:predicted enzyme related to lactoylglutathione lyase
MQGPLWWTFTVENCDASVEALRDPGVESIQDPTEWPWVVEAMFEDPFGNEFSLPEYAEMD